MIDLTDRIHHLEAAYAAVKGIPVTLTRDQTLLDDLDIDSLDAIELVELLEAKLDVPLLERIADVLGDVVTVGDLLDALDELAPG